MSTSREVDNETMAGVNSRFTEVTENDIFPFQDFTIPNDTDKESYEIKNDSLQSQTMF